MISKYACRKNACYHSVQDLVYSPLLPKNIRTKVMGTIILHVVLYGCKPWSLILREEHRLNVFENRVLREIFGAGKEEVTGEWRKLHSEELHDLQVSQNFIWMTSSMKIRWAGHVARMRESRNAYSVWMGKTEERKSLLRTRCRWIALKWLIKNQKWGAGGRVGLT
jgi:hypothetical protein